jgi:hypothetical protein
VHETLGGERVPAAERLDELAITVHAGPDALSVDVRFGHREAGLGKHVRVLLSKDRV